MAGAARSVSQADRIAELIREWSEAHDGDDRPHRNSLLTGQALNLK